MDTGTSRAAAAEGIRPYGRRRVPATSFCALCVVSTCCFALSKVSGVPSRPRTSSKSSFLGNHLNACRTAKSRRLALSTLLAHSSRRSCSWLSLVTNSALRLFTPFIKCIVVHGQRSFNAPIHSVVAVISVPALTHPPSTADVSSGGLCACRRTHSVSSTEYQGK